MCGKCVHVYEVYVCVVVCVCVCVCMYARVMGVCGEGGDKEEGVESGGGGRIYLHIQQVELDWIVSVHVLVREEKLFSQSQDNRLLNPLLS